MNVCALVSWSFSCSAKVTVHSLPVMNYLVWSQCAFISSTTTLFDFHLSVIQWERLLISEALNLYINLTPSVKPNGDITNLLPKEQH